MHIAIAIITIDIYFYSDERKPLKIVKENVNTQERHYYH